MSAKSFDFLRSRFVTTYLVPVAWIRGCVEVGSPVLRRVMLIDCFDRKNIVNSVWAGDIAPVFSRTTLN